MEALRDPFSRVHPVFWPVLWLSLRAFVRWTGRMIEEGHAYAGLRIELTWYGWIHVEAIDLTEVGADFRRHMMGAAQDDGWSVLADAAGRVEEILKVGCLEGAVRYAPSVSVERADGAYRFAPCTLQLTPEDGTGPPLGPAPLPCVGGGAVQPFPVAPNPRPARARVLAGAYALVVCVHATRQAVHQVRGHFVDR
ncbi:MAG: hypothetical protein AAFQ22_01040 [Pseudomonadota bacterium]